MHTPAGEPRGRIFNGDCIDVMRKMPSASVDLIVTDPPYLTDYRPRDGRKVTGDRDGAWLKPAFEEAYRLLKPDTFCVSFYGWPQAEKFLSAWKEVGFYPAGHLVCVKNYPSSNRGYALAHHETLYLLAKGNPPKSPKRSKDVLDWSYTGNVRHPTEKPVKIIRKLIEMFSKPGDVVLDPFAGSGTTGAAALSCGRRFLLIEKVLSYCQGAQRRLEKEAARYQR